MPPKKQKTDMQKLHEKLKKQKQALKQIKPQKQKSVRIPTELGLIKNIKENKEMRYFFTELIQKPDGQVVLSIEKFASDPKGAWDRKRFFQKFLRILPEKYYKEFAEEFITQEKRGRDDFWEYFIKLPVVVADLRKIQDLEDLEDIEIEQREKKKRLEKIEKKRLKKIQVDFFGEDSDTDTDTEDERRPSVVPKPKPKAPGSIKIVKIGLGGEVIDEITPPNISVKPKGFKIKPSTCLERYLILPWINGRVETVFLAPVDGTDITPYISATGKTVEKNGETWYQSVRAFTELMCNIHASSRTQNGDVLTAFTSKGKPVRMKVAYNTNRGFIVQDEAIFQAEKEYLSETRMTRDDKINKILDGPVTSSIEEQGMRSLSRALHKVAPDIKDYGIYYGSNNKYDTAYNIKAIEIISDTSQTAREFFDKLGNVIVYINLDEDSVKIFRKRIQQEYYLPEILVTLSPSEKLPEYFDDPRVTEEQIDRIARRVRLEVNSFVYNAGLVLYNQENNTKTRLPDIRPTYIGRMPNARGWKSICVNKDDVQDVPDEQIIYYREDDDVYCLTIPDIMEQILSKRNPENPYTGTPLSEAFIERFSKLYSVELKKKGYGGSGGTPEPTPTVPTVPMVPMVPMVPTPVLAPDLLNTIVRNIKECEDELLQENLEEDGRCTGLNGAPDSDSASDGEDHEVIENVSTTGETPILDELLVSDTESSGYSPVIVSREICQYCKKKVNPNTALKTKVDGEEGFQTVYFCCFKCFENQNQWTKKRSMKRKNSKKKNKNSKKGGRNSTRERKKTKN